MIMKKLKRLFFYNYYDSSLRDFSFQDDPTAMVWLQELYHNVSNRAQWTTIPTGELLASLIRPQTE
jgi:hypothetical protein